jgi:hypothetical protein
MIHQLQHLEAWLKVLELCLKPWDRNGKPINNNMDKDSKVIFENYLTRLVTEQFNYDEQSGATGADQETNQNITINNMVNRLLVTSPMDFIKSVNGIANVLGPLNMVTPGRIQMVYGGILALSRFINKGETGRELINLEKIADNQYNEAERSAQQLQKIVIESKKINKDLNSPDVSRVLNSLIFKIKLNFKNINDISVKVDAVKEKRFSKIIGGDDQIEINIKPVSEYFRQFSSFLSSSGITQRPVNNVEEVEAALVQYINTSYGSGDQYKQPQVEQPGATVPPVGNTITVTVEQFKNFNSYKNNPTNGDKAIEIARNSPTKTVQVGNYTIKFTDL